MNTVIQIPQVNTVSLLRRRPLTSEWAIYNNTIDFIDDLPSKLDRDKTSILIGHVPLTYINEKQVVPIIKVSYFHRLCTVHSPGYIF